MCDDHDHHLTTEGALHQSHPHGGPSRRSLLRGGVATAAVGALWPGLARAAGPAAAAAARSAGPSLSGDPLFRAAEHIHARGSEGVGSMTAQAAEASKHVDVMWFTDHDWREAGIGAPRVVHFNSLTDERLPPNPPWRWKRVTDGKLAQSGGGIETVDVSPRDPDPSGALSARAVGAKKGRASVAWYRTERDLRYSSRTPAYGQTWQIEVLLREASPDAWGFVRVGLSYHPAIAGRPSALYFIEYRFGPFRERAYSTERLVFGDLGGGGDDDGGDDPTDHESEVGVLGVVWVPTEPGAYRTALLEFTKDIEQLFPGMIARDNSIHSLWLGATSSSRAPANVCFDYLRMDRIYGQEQFEDRRAITEELAPRYPGVRMYNGTEVSYAVHRHWLGGDIVLPTYGGTRRADGADAPTRTEIVQMINAAGGFSVANHPFGTADVRLTNAQARAEAAHIVQGLLDTEANGGLHGIEVFYRKRAGASLEDHWLMYRLAVRNGLVLTASGVSDNHGGREGSWEDADNHFLTGLFAEDVTESSLLDAQRRGRAFASEIGSFDGQLDIALDDDVMGQIGIRPQKVSRRLTIQADALRAGSTVEVWTIPVDLGGLAGNPGGVIANVPASAFANGTASVDVDTRRDCAFAVMVRNADQVRVAGSNPVWHLKAEPSWTIPDERRAL